MSRTTLTALLATSALAIMACGEGQSVDASAQSDNQDMSGEAEALTRDADVAQDDTMAAPDPGQDGMGVSMDRETATLIDRDRNEVGMVTFHQGPEGVVVQIEADGIGEDARGSWHGAHLHETADCSADDFTSSGSHINPSGNAHGLLNADGPDNADLPNIWVGDDGTLRAQAYTTRVSLSGQTDAPSLLDADGSAVVIHESPDDYESQPIGGAGARILCAEIGAAQ